MRLTTPKSTIRVGDIEICGVQRVLELDALETSTASDSQGQAPSHLDHTGAPAAPATATATTTATTQAIPPAALHAIQSRTAIVVPCKDECPRRIAGVWAAIPASSLVVLVSGSSAAAYARERDALADFCRLTGRRGVAVRQRDPAAARALRGAGMCALLDGDGDGLVYGGKGEGLVLGIALAAAARGPSSSGNRDGGAPGYYKYIGFIDADNFVPGSVQEYCRAFSAGLHLAQAEDAMVRINWGSKPKVRDGRLEFKPSGRSSEIVNRWLNSLVRKMDGVSSSNVVIGHAEDDEFAVESERDTAAAIADDEDDIICTGNAGEHAMTISLALKLRLASGYAIEPFHFLDLWERFSGRQSSNERQVPSSPPLSMSPPTSPVYTPVSCGSPLLSASENSTPPSPPSGFFSTIMGPTPSTTTTTTITTTGSSTAASAHADETTTPPLATPPPPKIQVLQIRTLNPHFHEDKGEAHVLRMWRQGLSAVYHSPVTAGLAQYRENLRSAILGGGGGGGGVGAEGGLLETRTRTSRSTSTSSSSSSSSSVVLTPPFSSSASDDGQDGVYGGSSSSEAAVLAAAEWQPERCRVYPPAGGMHLGAFMEGLESEAGSFWSSGEQEGPPQARGDSEPAAADDDGPGLGFDSVAALDLGRISGRAGKYIDVDWSGAFAD